MNNLINVFKLLSDETRLRIIHLLADHELCVCQITGILEISQPKASKALSKLRDLNLVIDHRIDKFVYYKLNDNNKMLNHILDHIASDRDSYEQLQEDMTRVSLKEEFLTNCSTTTLKV